MKTYDGNKIRKQFGWKWGETMYTITVMSLEEWLEYGLQEKLNAAIADVENQERAIITEQINFVEASSDIPPKTLWKHDAHAMNVLFGLCKGEEDHDKAKPVDGSEKN